MLIWKKSGSNTNYNSTVWSAIKSGTPVHVSLYFTDSGIRLEDQDVSIENGLVLTDIFNGDTDLVFGKAISRQIRVRFLNSSRLNGLSWTSEFELSFKVTIGTTEYTAVAGYFVGEKPKNVTTAQYIDFTAYDNMKKFDVLADDFVNGLTYPKTISQIFSSLCAFVGVTAGSTSSALANALSRSFAAAPVDMVGYTCRDVLGWIAEACGCYAVMNGHSCDLVWFTNNTAHAISQTEEFGIETGDLNPGLTWNEFDALTNAQQESMTFNDIAGFSEAYAVDQVLIKQLNSDFDVNYPSVLGGNVYTITGNPFLVISTSSDVTNYVKPIYDRLVALGGYLPINLNCIGDPSVQAGDIITVNVNGTNYTIPIFMKTMKWNGMCEDDIETTGQIPRATYSNEAGKEKVLNAKELRMYVYDHYYDRKSGITITDGGIVMDGSTFIDIKSGSRIDIESGAKINVESGGDINLESGADLNVKSGSNLNVGSGGDIEVVSGGNVNVNSGGKVNIKSGADIDVKSGGDINVASGGNMNVASGGNLNVASGGNIDINGSGNLKLSGSTVEIKSGSTFDVDSTNFKISSQTGVFETSGWKLNSDGLMGYVYYDSLRNGAIGIGGTGLFSIPQSTYLLGITGGYSTYSGGTHDLVGYFYLRMQYPDSSREQLKISAGEGVVIDTEAKDRNNNTTSPGGTLGTQAGKWDVWGKTIHYTTLSQNSSRDIKHDIRPMESIGEKLDRLAPVTFVYDDDENEKTRMGMIYENTMEVMPEICTDDESDKAINYVELIPALLKEIQELRIRVAELERGN